MNPILTAVLIYLAVVSLISVIITVKDKAAAKLKKRRVPENTLLLFGAIGGATLMFITMLIIRHKTKHLKFMIPLPLMSIVHIVLLTLLVINI